MRTDVVALLLVTAIAALLPRAVGPVLLGGRPLAPPLRRMLEMLAPALLTALIVVGVWGSGTAADRRRAPPGSPPASSWCCAGGRWWRR